MRASLKCSLHCLVHIVGLRLLIVCSGGNVNVDARPNLHVRRHAGNGAFRLAQHVVGRQTFFRNPVKRLFVILLHAVSEIEDLSRRQIGKQGRMNIAHILSQSRTAAVVIHHDFEKVGVLAELGVVLLRSIEWRERIVVPDMPAHALRRCNAMGQRVHRAIRVIESFIPQSFP